MRRANAADVARCHNGAVGAIGREGVWEEITRLPAPVLDALVTASVVGVEGDVGTLAAAHRVSTADLVDLLEQARGEQLLPAVEAGRWRFTDALVRDVVYETVTGSVRARRHAQVLEALEPDRAVPPAAIAGHALAALPVLDPVRVIALLARAGEDAFSRHVYGDAVSWYERALAAVPTGAPAELRAEVLVACGEACRHAGDIDAARRAFLDASALTEDPNLLARAALGYASPGADLGIAYRTEEPVTVGLLERAIAVQPDPETALMVQLEARLGSELYFSDEPERARSLMRGALERAQRLGDPRALVVATAVVHDALVVGQTGIDHQLAESEQLLAWARSADSHVALLTAHRSRVLDLLAAGDLAGVDSEIVAFTQLADHLGVPGYQWWSALWSAMRALLEGRHELAEERALAAFRLGEAPFASLAFTNLSFFLFFLRREQGRLAEMEQATREYAASRADIPALRAAHAFLLAELGRIDEARSTLGAFDAAALERLRDRNWPASWFQLARVAFRVGDGPFAAELLRSVNRPTERCIQISLGTVCLGATDLAAAWLHEAVGDLDAADEAYRSAADMNARIGARSWLAQARADHARLLVARGRPGDREEAERLAGLAAAAATDIGLATVEGELAGESRPSPLARATFRRAGAVWELAYAERVVQVPDARGLRDLGYLLSRPGEAVSVLELVDEPGAVAGASDRGAPTLDEQARREIRAALRRLDQAEADAEAAGDGEQAALVREQRQQLAEAVSRDLGLGGRARRVGDPVERARKTVSTRIRRTIAAIGKVHPELGRHLDRSIDTGTWCAYRPPEPVDWRT